MNIDLTEVLGNKSFVITRLKENLKLYKLDHYIKRKIINTKVIGKPYTTNETICEISVENLRKLVSEYFNHPNTPKMEDTILPSMIILREFLNQLDNNEKETK